MDHLNSVATVLWPDVSVTKAVQVPYKISTRLAIYVTYLGLRVLGAYVRLKLKWLYIVFINTVRDYLLCLGKLEARG